MSSSLDQEIERITLELTEEEALRDTLEESSQKMRENVEELKQQITALNEEEDDNEWKQQWEDQHSINENMEAQLMVLKEKVAQLQRLDSRGDDAEEMSQTEMRNLVRSLQREKKVLEGQLRDKEWRLNSEAMQLHRLNEEKKKFLLDVGQRADGGRRGPKKRLSDERKAGKGQTNISTLESNARNSTQYQGIPDNQRILDPSKGPVKRSVAVRSLPKINSTSSSDSNDSTPKKKRGKRKSNIQAASNVQPTSNGVGDTNEQQSESPPVVSPTDQSL